MNPSPQKPALDIPNLPEGVEAYDLRVASDGEFELVGDRILKGVRPGAAAGLIVRPAAGYAFAPEMKYDIRVLGAIPGRDGVYMVVKQQAPVNITATLKVVVTNSFDQGVVENALGVLGCLPGFVSLDRQ